MKTTSRPRSQRIVRDDMQALSFISAMSQESDHLDTLAQVVIYILSLQLCKAVLPSADSYTP